jgi:phage gp16-like protein
MRRGDRAASRAASAALPAERRVLIAKVHVARKQLAMAEESYRALLRRVTGHDSAAAAGVDALIDVLDEFRRLGFTGERRRAEQPHVRKIYALWGALKPHLENPSEEALRAFVQRQTGVGAPSWLDSRQANKVIEGLKAWLRRVGAEVPHG